MRITVSTRLALGFCNLTAPVAVELLSFAIFRLLLVTFLLHPRFDLSSLFPDAFHDLLGIRT